jgi:hypothetical protein
MRYFLLTYYRKPDGKIDESATVAKRVKTRDWQMTNVILDFKDLKVLKCSMQGVQVPPNWDRIVTYYYQYYKATIDRLLTENGYEVVPPEAEPVVEDLPEAK